jgi:hypothetical protein
MKMRIDQVVLDNPASIEQFYTRTGKPLSVKGISGQKDNYLASTVVAVCNQKGHGIGRKPWMNIENIASAWMCIENILLAATADGLAAQISIFREEHKIAVEKILDIPEDCELTTVLLLGETEEKPGAKKIGLRPDYSWLHKNRFGNRS